MTWKIDGIRYEMDFVSPYVKYGGSIEMEYLSRDYSIVFGDTAVETNFSGGIFDIWLARALQPFPDKRKNLILGIRNQFINFEDRPVAEPDSNEQFLNRNLILGSLETSKRNFLKTQNVRTIGITEDLPVGYLYGITLGADFNEFGNRIYTAGRFIWSDYYPFGYFQYYTELGGFPDDGKMDNGLWVNEIKYFTPLWRRRLTTYRLFSNIVFQQGINLNFPLSIKLRDYMRGVSGDFNRGEQMLYLSLEGLAYTPWYWYGFRFAPLALAEYGTIHDKRLSEPFRNHYVALGTGIRITNPGLIINTFETTVKYFPVKGPDSQSFYFSISVSTPLFIRSHLSSKPRVVSYNFNQLY